MLTVAIDETIKDADDIFRPPMFKCVYYAANTTQLAVHCDVLLCRSYTTVDELFLQKIKPSIVATLTSGTNHINTDYLRATGIMLVDAKGANSQAVAEFIFSILNHFGVTKSTKVGIIGVGHIGTKIVRQLRHVGLDLICYDPLKEEISDNFTTDKFESLYDCDVLTWHIPLTLEGKYKTYERYGDDFFSKLNDNAILVNTSRGAIFNEQELMKYIDKFQVCLDVFKNEPAVDQELLQRCYLATPHIAGHSIQSRINALKIVHRKILFELNVDDKNVFSASRIQCLLPNDLTVYQRKLFELSTAFKKCGCKCCFQKLRNQHKYVEIYPDKN